MVRPDTRARRATSFAITVITLVVIASLLGGLLCWLLKAAGQSKGEQQTYLVRMAAMATASLLLTLMILLYVVARYVAQRITAPSEKRQPTPYVNAWVEAGRRLKPEDAPPVPGFEDPEEGPRDDDTDREP